MTSRWLLLSALVLAACEPSTKGVDINSKAGTKYASIRVFNFLDDVVSGPYHSTDTILTIENELPVSFGGLTGPTITDYQQAAIGQWVTYLSVGGNTLVQAAVQNPTEGQRLTLTEFGQLPSAVLVWSEDKFPTLQANQAGVRFILGDGTFSNDEIDLRQSSTPDANVATLSGSAILGQTTDWQLIPSTPDTLVVTGNNTVSQFTITPPAAGSFHTYAVVVLPEDSSAELKDIVENTDGGSAQVTTINATPTNP